jgi:hypothetical protein
MDPQQRHLMEAVHTLALMPTAHPAFAAAAGLPGWGPGMAKVPECEGVRVLRV